MGFARQSTNQTCLDGGGEMGALMRARDWSETRLGSVELWPQSLRTSVSTCLNSRFAILIWWGPDLVMLYNDAYREIIGSKHPAALGNPGRECWPEIWHVIGPMLTGVLERGEATWSDDLLLLLERHGYPEECYFTFSYSPIHDESGGVGGVFTPVTETTDKVVGGRRLRTLRDLATRGSTAKRAEDACRVAAETLAANPYDVPFAALYLYSAGRKEARLVGSAGIEPGSPACPAVISFEDERKSPIAAAAASQRTEMIGNLAAYAGPLPGGAWPVAAKSGIVLPLIIPGQPLAAGFLLAGISPRKRLDQSYRTFFELAAGQIATAIAEARSYEEERKRAEALAELDRAKTTFFSNVSHEFRTPLTLMLGPIENVLAGGSDSFAFRRAELELIHRNAERLLKLVNTLLDFSRIEAGRIEACYEPVDLPRLTSDLASFFHSAMDRAGLQFTIDCPPMDEPVFVDREMWEKIVLNLISNAFKFTFEGEIAVSLRKAGEHVELSVRDTGTGIQEEELPHVFERFRRVEGAQGRTQEGSGIGLALVHELVKLHGGTVRVESVFGAGSIFTVRIPLGRDHLPAGRVGGRRTQASTTTGARPYVEEALRSLPDTITNSAAIEIPAAALWPAAAEGQARGERRSRILLADDNADMREYLRRILKEQYEIHAVASGDAALAFIRNHAPDLVLADVMMPGLDGFALLDAIRNDSETAAVPVILLSARAGEEARIEGLEAGADDYLTKPFSVRELLARVASQLAIARLRREAAERERQLRLEAEAERRRWRDLLQQAPAAIAVLRGPEHVFELVNAEYCRATGRPDAASLTGKPVREALPEVAGQGLLELLDQVYRTGEPVFGNERLVRLDRRGDGTLEDRYFNFAYQPSRSAAGEMEGVLVHAVDVTEQVLARRRIEESERLARSRAAELQATMDAVPAAIFIAHGADCAEMAGNRTTYELLRMPPGRNTSKSASAGERPEHFTVFRDGREIPADEQPVQLAARTGKPVRNFQFELAFRDGSRAHLFGNAVPLLDDGGRTCGAVGAFIDISERKRMEERLLEAQKLESVGVLAGGIAHDFNNLLVAVLGNASLAQDLLPPGSPVRALLEEIEKASERAAHLTRQMLAYAGKGQFVIERVDLSVLVRETTGLIQASISKQISLRLDLPLGLPPVEADSSQLQQVVMNLVLNGAEAIGERAGVLWIRTGVENLDAEYIKGRLEADITPGLYVCLEVSDTGAGIDAAVRSKIFDPFFTTKFTGRGLGLAAVAGIVRGHHGAIQVSSEPGKGSTFLALFPAVGARAGTRAPVHTPRHDLRGAGLILVVDDEEVVLRTARLALQRHGYEVLAAKSGAEAVEMLGKESRPIDLVLLDSSMPGMNGQETLIELRKIQPRLKALISSGYSETETLRRFAGQAVAGFVQKPYSVGRLAGKVKSALGDASAER